MSDDPKCVAGCVPFYGGEKRHHKDCPYYPESLTKLNADRIEELEERLKAATDDAKEAEAYAGELEAKLAKADKLASEFKNCLEVLTKEDGYVCCSGHQCGCYGASLHAQAIYYANEAIDDYHKTTGGKDE